MIVILVVGMMLLGVFMEFVPVIFHFPMGYIVLFDVFGSGLILLSFIVLVYKLMQTDAYFLVEGGNYAMISYHDGSTKIVPVKRLPARYLETRFGLIKDRTSKPLRFNGGAVIYPATWHSTQSTNLKFATYSTRMKDKYDIKNANELYLFARKVQDFINEHGHYPGEEELQEIRASLGKSEEDKKILGYSKKELKQEMKRHPVKRGILKEEIIGETVDYVSFIDFMLDEGQEQDFKTILEMARLSEKLGKREEGGLLLAPNVRKLFVWLAIIAGVLILGYILLQSGVLDTMLSAFGGGM